MLRSKRRRRRSFSAEIWSLGAGFGSDEPAFDFGFDFVLGFCCWAFFLGAIVSLPVLRRAKKIEEKEVESETMKWKVAQNLYLDLNRSIRFCIKTS